MSGFRFEASALRTAAHSYLHEMTDDPDLIARIYPMTRFPMPTLVKGPTIVQTPENDRPRLIPPGQVDGLHPVEHIELRFSNGSKSSHGFQVGRDSSCDVILHSGPSVSAPHFALQFDDANRLVVRDLGSCSGTRVDYFFDDEDVTDTPDRSHGWPGSSTWIIGGIPSLEECGYLRVVITIGAGFKFLVVVPHRDSSSPVYRGVIEALKRGPQDEFLIRGLQELRLSDKALEHWPQEDTLIKMVHELKLSDKSPERGLQDDVLIRRLLELRLSDNDPEQWTHDDIVQKLEELRLTEGGANGETGKLCLVPTW